MVLHSHVFSLRRALKLHSASAGEAGETRSKVTLLVNLLNHQKNESTWLCSQNIGDISSPIPSISRFGGLSPPVYVSLRLCKRCTLYRIANASIVHHRHAHTSRCQTITTMTGIMVSLVSPAREIFIHILQQLLSFTSRAPPLIPLIQIILLRVHSIKVSGQF